MTHRFVHRYMNWSPVSEIGSYDESHEHLPDSELVFAYFSCQDEQGNWLQHCKFHRGLVLKHLKTIFLFIIINFFSSFLKFIWKSFFFSCLHFEFIFISFFFGLWWSPVEKMKHFWVLLGFLGAFEAVSGCDRLGFLLGMAKIFKLLEKVFQSLRNWISKYKFWQLLHLWQWETWPGFVEVDCST